MSRRLILKAVIYVLDMSFGEAVSRFAATDPDELGQQQRDYDAASPLQGEFELIQYQTADCVADFTLDPSNETVWATQAQMATLFGVGVAAINKHINNIYAEAELFPNATFSKLEIVRAEGSRSVKRLIDHYNLDMILSVGYRVSSQKATAFRQWATRTLKDYIVQGFAINEARLRDDPNALRDLAAQVRALRADEKNIYKSVRDVFAVASSDYNKDAPDIGRFFAKLQDKFTYAVTGQISSQILLDRASHLLDDMGLTTKSGSRPSHADIRIAKNYLDRDELYRLHLLCEQFLLFIESAALRGMKMTMAELSSKFDDLLRLVGHHVFTEYKDALKERAIAHVVRELELYQDRLVAEKSTARRSLR